MTSFRLTVAVLAVVLVAGTGAGRAAKTSSHNSGSTIVPAIAIAAGGAHTCALTQLRGVKCWGSSYAGQLGNGGLGDRSTPVDVSGLTGVTAIAAGWRHSCALTRSGGVKCWGHNGFGQVGDGTTGIRLTPVDVAGLSNGVAAIAAGGDHSCALTNAGGVKCWGLNANGALGDGTTINRLTPVDVSGLSSGVTAIAAGGFHSCALTGAGGVKCWGFNRLGQLGDGTTDDRLTPVDVSGLTVGVDAITSLVGHSCALRRNQDVRCWGNNASGALGDGTTAGRLTPVSVVGLAGDLNTIAAGSGFTCALSRAGAVRCWGLNDFGQLGDGTTDNRSTPVAVSGLADGAAAIAAGGGHACALMLSGAAKCWGNNEGGALGDGTTGTRRRPVSVIGVGWATATLAIASPSSTVTSTGIAMVKLRCGSQASCRGRVILTAAVKGELVGSAAYNVKFELGRRRFAIAAGRTQVVKVRLTGRGFKLLTHVKRLSAVVHARYEQPAGGMVKATRTVTLVASKGIRRR